MGALTPGDKTGLLLLSEVLILPGSEAALIGQRVHREYTGAVIDQFLDEQLNKLNWVLNAGDILFGDRGVKVA
jgi:hypothetical protein